MHEGLKTILEQLYEQTPDIEALKEALILLVNNGELSTRSQITTKREPQVMHWGPFWTMMTSNWMISTSVAT